MSNYFNIDMDHVRIRIISFAVEDIRQERVLKLFDNEYQVIDKQLKEAIRLGDDDYIEYLSDNESEFSETMVGVCFLICQSKITSIVSRIIKVSDNIPVALKRKFTSKNKINKDDILNYGNKYKNTCYTDVKFIDSFANYYKHHEEKHWSISDWSLNTGKALQTSKVIKITGAKPGNSGNMRIGARFLGISNLNNISNLIKMVNNWGNKIVQEYHLSIDSSGKHST